MENNKPCNVSRLERCKKDGFIDARYIILGALASVILVILGFTTLLTSIIVVVPFMLFIGSAVFGIITFTYTAQPIRY